MRRLALAVVAAVGILFGFAGPASAHVHISPDEAPKGGDATLTFSVPDESDTASTTQVAIQFPSDHPIAVVDVEPVPGWTTKVDTQKFATPVKTDSGDVTEGVSVITWSGGTIKPGEFQRFVVAVDSLPDDADSLAFNTVQTYDNGDVVRWIEATPAGGPEPEHPAPVLTLGADDAAAHDHSETSTTVAETTTTVTAGQTASAVLPTDLAKTSDVDSARTVGIIGIVIGALGLLVAIGALAFRRKNTPSDSA